MVGHFFVTFIFVMAFLAVASVFLWQYIAKLHSRFSASIIAIILTGAALAALVLYGADFRGLVDSPFFTPAFYGSMAGLSWLFMFLLAFPILVPLAICVFLGRRLRPVDKKKPATQHHLAATQITRRTFLKGEASP